MSVHLRYMLQLAAVAALGGTAGSALRELATLAATHAEWPAWCARAAVNVIGALLAGVAVGRWALPEATDPLAPTDRALRLREHLVVTGLAGGLTTVSGYAHDAAQALAGALPDAAASLGAMAAANGVAGIASAAAGVWLGRRWFRRRGPGARASVQP